MHLCIGVAARLGIRRVRFPDDRCLVAPLGQMPVDAVGADVEHTVGKPFHAEIRFVEAALVRLAGESQPIQALCAL